jgi:hypothetical protein
LLVFFEFRRVCVCVCVCCALEFTPVVKHTEEKRKASVIYTPYKGFKECK